MADYGDRNTTSTVDPVAQKAFRAKMRAAGRPAVKRAPVAAAAPKLSVMATIWQSLDQIAAQLMGRRQSDMSGIQGREMDFNREAAVNAAQGLDKYGNPRK
jgi:hypothetical protein